MGERQIERTREVCVYSNRYLSLFDDEVIFPGNVKGRYVRMVWSAPYSVAVLPITPNRELVLLRQFSYGIGRHILQVPKGMGEAHDTPEQTARRELQEEAGYQAATLRLLKTVYVDPGLIANPTHIFVALDARPGRSPQHESTEVIDRIELVELARARDGSIWNDLIDSTTMVALSLAQQAIAL